MLSKKSIGAYCVFSLILMSQPSFAEFYSSRPLIEDIKASPAKGRHEIENWPELREGAFRFLAEMVAFYPDRDLYLLGRDGEYMYDMARVLFSDNKEALDRIHLINVSTKNRLTSGLQGYLEQEVLGRARATGRKPIMLDTGLEGKIHNTVNELMVKLKLPHFDTHMMSSAHPEIPSSRAAADPFVKKRGDGDISEGGADMAEALEDVPHYTNTSTELVKAGKRYEADNDDPQDPKTREIALALMADVKHFALQEKNKVRFFEMIKNMRSIISMATGHSALNPKAAKEALKELSGLGVKTFLLDLRETTYKNLIRFHPARLQEFWIEAAGKVPSVDDFEDDFIEELAESEEHLADYVNEPKKAAKMLAEEGSTRDQLKVLKELLKATAPAPTTRNAIVKSVFGNASGAPFIGLINEPWIVEVDPAAIAPALEAALSAGMADAESVHARLAEVTAYKLTSRGVIAKRSEKREQRLSRHEDAKSRESGRRRR